VPVVTIRVLPHRDCDVRAPEIVARMLRCVGDTLVRELDLEPGNVLVTFEEVEPGRLYDAAS
jgi:phenylpyruvate tautomerase PptA (4-oxalocrotonate tautomerase family)